MASHVVTPVSVARIVYQIVIESRANVRLHLVFAAVLLILAGCDQESQNQKIATLEKANQELKAAVEKSHAVEEYDLQAKCSKDAKAWFKENWQRDKDRLLLDFTNHCNKSMNKCFILVEYHYSVGKEGAWANDMTIGTFMKT